MNVNHPRRYHHQSLETYLNLTVDYIMKLRQMSQILLIFLLNTKVNIHLNRYSIFLSFFIIIMTILHTVYKKVPNTMHRKNILKFAKDLKAKKHYQPLTQTENVN